MAERRAPHVFSIAAHRGFADALVAGLAPRYAEPDFGLARLTLLLPSARAMRTVSEAFIRLYGSQGAAGMLMPRMVAVGDLDLDETLGPLLDPLGDAGIPPAVEPGWRWLRLAQLIGEVAADKGWGMATRLRLARDMARTIDRLLVEDVAPEQLRAEGVAGLEADLAAHWQASLALFDGVLARWNADLAARGLIDAATRRNRLFERAAEQWRATPPRWPVVAAGVTSAAPALARLLRVIAEQPHCAVVLPDFDLGMDQATWDELGRAGRREAPDDPPFGRDDAVTHPQYHLKLLLERMAIRREEVQPWHRKGLSAAPPERSQAIASLFLPPEASKGWVALPPEKRRLAGVRLMECANPEEEAQAIALIVRGALEEPDKRIAVITADRALARRVVHHLARWNIVADDSAGRPLSHTPAGRLVLLLAELVADGFAPVPLVALLQHPLVRREEGRGDWLRAVRRLDLALRGPRTAPGLAGLRQTAAGAGLTQWWGELEPLLARLPGAAGIAPLADLIGGLVDTAEALCGSELWSREDGRALSAFIEDLRTQARAIGTLLEQAELPQVLREAMDEVAVRPQWGVHSRIAFYGLLESRMARADLAICAGLNEGSWPGTPAPDPLLAPPLLRMLGVPGADFRIGLAAHDLAGALGTPEVVLSRARRDAEGPTKPSRFLLRVKALLGGDPGDPAALLARHREEQAVAWARALDHAVPAAPYPVPEPCPSPDQRRVPIAVTALDGLRGQPYQFYARAILRLRVLDPLDAEPSAAWQGTLVHEILKTWHDRGGSLVETARRMLAEANAHPLLAGLWLPRLIEGLAWIEAEIAAQPDREVVATERRGAMEIDGVRIHGRADRIDRLPDGTLAIIDYKTGKPPTAKQVGKGYALQLGLIGMMAERGGIENLAAAEPSEFLYWSLARTSDGGFGYLASPVKWGSNKAEMAAGDFLPQTERYLREAIAKWINGSEPFTARIAPDFKGYADYDQLMRLDEWHARFDSEDPA